MRVVREGCVAWRNRVAGCFSLAVEAVQGIGLQAAVWGCSLAVEAAQGIGLQAAVWGCSLEAEAARRRSLEE